METGTITTDFVVFITDLLVSMKSGLGDRNNLAHRGGIHPGRYVSMKSGLGDRNNDGDWKWVIQDIKSQ